MRLALALIVNITEMHMSTSDFSSGKSGIFEGYFHYRTSTTEDSAKPA